jgi:hypothetical protein
MREFRPSRTRVQSNAVRRCSFSRGGRFHLSLRRKLAPGAPSAAAEFES